MNFWRLYEHIQSAVAGFKSAMHGYVLMAYTRTVNGEIVLNSYLWLEFLLEFLHMFFII